MKKKPTNSWWNYKPTKAEQKSAKKKFNQELLRIVMPPKLNWKRIWQEYDKWWKKQVFAGSSWENIKRTIQRIVNKQLKAGK